MNLTEKYIAYKLSTLDLFEDLTLQIIDNQVVPEIEILAELELFIMHEKHLAFEEKVAEFMVEVNDTLRVTPLTGSFLMSVSQEVSLKNVDAHESSCTYKIWESMMEATNSIVLAESLNLTTLRRVRGEQLYVPPVAAVHLAYLVNNKGYHHLVLRPQGNEAIGVFDVVTGVLLAEIPLTQDREYLAINYSLELVNASSYDLNEEPLHDLTPNKDFEFKYVPRLSEII